MITVIMEMIIMMESLMVDSDDVYLPHKLERQVNMIEAENYGLIYGGTIIIDKSGKEIGRQKLNNKSA